MKSDESPKSMTSPRHTRALAALKESLVQIERALDELEPHHPDRDDLDDIHADLRYVLLKFEGRL